MNFSRLYCWRQVLDLMVRMLGFCDEDKQRIGVAQQGAGKGVVRGVLGLPGRLVGGILSGSHAEAAANVGSENQVSFFWSVVISPLGAFGLSSIIAPIPCT